jgi:hypothetical protein
MAAGESAREVARRAREKSQRLERYAAMYEQGAEGESATAGVLVGLQPEWIALHDYRWPGRRLANIDHIVVGPGGIFVVDSKNWSGDLRIDGQTLRQNGRSREKNVAGVADAALAVLELVAAHAHLVRGVLCFVGDRPLSGWVRDVMVCSTANLAEMLRTRERVLDAQEVNDIATWLDARLSSASTPAVSAERRTGEPARRPSRTNASQRRAAAAPAGRTRSGGASAKRALLGLLVGLILLITLPFLPAISAAIGQGFVGMLVDDSSCVDEGQSTRADAERPRERKNQSASSAATGPDCQ